MALHPEAELFRKLAGIKRLPTREDLMEHISRELKKMQRAVKAEPYQVAWLAGIGLKTYMNIIERKSCPQGLTITKLAQAMRCSPQQLMPSLDDIE